MTFEQKALWKAIDIVLWEDWDPIGVNDVDDWRNNEYSGYAPQIFKLKTNGAEAEDIANQLYEYEIDRMGLTGNMENCKAVAKKIIEL